MVQMCTLLSSERDLEFKLVFQRSYFWYCRTESLSNFQCPWLCLHFDTFLYYIPAYSTLVYSVFVVVRYNNFSVIQFNVCDGSICLLLELNLHFLRTLFLLTCTMKRVYRKFVTFISFIDLLLFHLSVCFISKSFKCYRFLHVYDSNLTF